MKGSIRFWFCALAASAAPSHAQEKPANPNGEFYAAIWSDLDLNALIGNGNIPGHHWMWVDGAKRIRDFQCATMKSAIARCSFTLIRDGGAAMGTFSDKPVPDTLRCHATFLPDAEKDGWQVEHIAPPPRGGHSQTTMKCRFVKAKA